MAPFAVESNSSEICREIQRQGFVVIPNALTEAEVAYANGVIDADLESHHTKWVRFDETLSETVDILSRTDELDFTIENPVTLDPLRLLLGEEIAFEEFEVIIREPTIKSQDIKAWHRDMIRDYSRRMEIEYLSVIYYLTDVAENDHCFSIIPETHNRLVDLKPEQVTPGDEVDITGPAGTAIIFHGRCIHTGKLKPHSRQRRTLHMYYWLANRARTSEWTEIPAS